MVLKEKILIREDNNGICNLILNRPSAHNALSFKLLSSIKDEINLIKEDKRIRVLIISANGPSFCSGHDLKEINSNKNKNDYDKLFNLCSEVMLSLLKLNIPVIAKVHSTATAAGCQLVATCDLAIASTNAKFATPGVNIGLFCSTPMVAVSRSLGRKKTMEMLLTGESMNANDAVNFGLINKNVSLNELEKTVLNFAKLIASKPTSTVRIGKEAFYKQAELPIEKAYKYTSEVMAQNMLEKDAKEGIEAFLEKREPKWDN